MNGQLTRLLTHLDRTLDPQRQAAEQDLHARALRFGPVEFCGRGEHLIGPMLELPSLRCIDLGQPDMNDLGAIYARAAERKIPLIRLRVPAQELLSGRVRDRFGTGVSLVHTAGSLDQAKRVFWAYARCASP